MTQKYCDKPDRHAPGLKCGYPTPCPYHRFELDLGKGELRIPPGATPEEVRRVSEIADALTEHKTKKRRR